MSTLIIGQNYDARVSAALEMAPDAVVLNPSGVEDVRELEKLINLRQAVIVTAAEKLTPEAQNAFLKTLEEAETPIILCAPKEDLLLDTVVSRCFIKDLGVLTKIATSPENLKVLDWIKNKDFIKGSLWAEKIKDRKEAIIILDQLLATQEVVLRAYAVRPLLRAKKYLLANTNVRLTLENLFI